MPYVIGYGMRNKRDMSTSQKATAKEAWSLVVALERSDEEIKFIRNPRGAEIGRDELKMDAEEEGRA
jgi:hypothetical protein